MQKKIRLHKMLIMGLAIIASIVIVSLIAGRHDTVPVYLINANDVDTQTPLDKQEDKLIVHQMLREEFETFGSTLITSKSDLKGARLKFPMRKGTPLTVDAITNTTSAGQFALDTPLYHTVFKLPDVVGSLPPGIQKGDKVDINLLVTDKLKVPGEAKERDVQLIGPLMTSVTVHSISENTLYLIVSQRDYQKLAVAMKMGEFVIQLPGQKEVQSCKTVLDALTKTKNEELNQLTSRINDFKTNNATLPKQEFADKLAALEKEKESLIRYHDHKISTAECADETDTLSTVNSYTILQELRRQGKVLPAPAQTPEAPAGADNQANTPADAPAPTQTNPAAQEPEEGDAP